MSELRFDLELAGRYITLRSPKPADYSVMRTILSDPDTMEHLKFMNKARGGWTLTEVQERYERSMAHPDFGRIMLIIESNETGNVVGDCGFSNIVIDHRRAEFGLVLDRAVWGTRVCKECHLLSLEYGFEKLNLRRIEWATSENNARMRRFLENIGANLECVRRDYWVDGETATNECVYTVFREQWPSVKEYLSLRLK